MKSIEFNLAMMRALIANRKHQTRRLNKCDKLILNPGCWDFCGLNFEGKAEFFGAGMETIGNQFMYVDPPYKVGDSVLVKEPFYIQPSLWIEGQEEQPIHYAVSTKPEQVEDYDPQPASNMPEWASRYKIVITDVRSQRLDSISNEDAIEEGIQEGYEGWHVEDGAFFDAGSPVQSFSRLWDAIYGNSDSNPWVWVYSFLVKPVV